MFSIVYKNYVSQYSIRYLIDEQVRISILGILDEKRDCLLLTPTY